MSVEIELRFRIDDVDAAVRELTALGGALSTSTRIVDVWFAPRHVVDLESHESWLREGRTGPLRVRETCLDGITTATIQAKRPVVNGDYSRNHEAHLALRTTEDGLAFAHALGYHRIVTLSKVRREWAFPHSVAHLDSYNEKAHILEIEAVSPGPRTEVLAHLQSVARGLGIDPATAIEASSALTLIREILGRVPLLGAAM